MENFKNKSEEEWKRELTPQQYQILREKGTEPAFTGAYWNHKEDGMYHCAACGAKLFSSKTKFDSGTGWPSFTEPEVRDVIETREDRSHGMRRTEVLCKNCGGHLGHVFDDLPAGRQVVLGAGGKRYCINSCSLDFKPDFKPLV